MKKIQDTWARKAKEAGYRSRAAYKLLQINKSHKLIENSNLIIELGSAPGGWSQVIARLKRQINYLLETGDYVGAKNQIDKLVAISSPSLPEIVIWKEGKE